MLLDKHWKLNDWNKSDIFSFDRGINRKKNGNLLQQCSTRIDAVFRSFLVDTSEKKMLDSFIKYFLIDNMNHFGFFNILQQIDL